MSVIKRFAELTFDTPHLKRRMSSPSIMKHPKEIMKDLKLTPIIEDFNELRLGTTDKKVKDDFNIESLTFPKINFGESSWRNDVKAAYAKALGKYGLLSQKLSMRKIDAKR